MKATGLEKIKLDAVIKALEDHLGNKTRAARSLGISIRSLRNYIVQYNELAGYKEPSPVPILDRCSGIVNNREIIKKKQKLRRSLEKDGPDSKNTFPTLAHIVLKNGSRVEIPKLPINISQLTIYDHMRIALEHAALAICSLRELGSGTTPRLAAKWNLATIRLNLEDLMNHIYYATETFDSEIGLS